LQAGAKRELCFYRRRRLEPAPSGDVQPMTGLWGRRARFSIDMQPLTGLFSVAALFTSSCRICNSAVMNISICNAQRRHTVYNKSIRCFFRITNAYTLHCRIANSAGRSLRCPFSRHWQERSDVAKTGGEGRRLANDGGRAPVTNDETGRRHFATVTPHTAWVETRCIASLHCSA
jgi:hypothetical protein